MKFSIITPVLNGRPIIESTLRSIMSQRDVDVEIIVVDCASTDGTTQFVRQLATTDPRIRWISKPDSGVYQALNRGMALATGDVIGILHAGDTFTNHNILATVKRYIADPDTSLVFGDVRFVNARGKIVRHYIAEGFKPTMLTHGFAPPHPSLYVKRQVYDTVGPYRESYRVAADFEYFVRLLLINKMPYRYIPIEMVEMLNGGLSCKWRNRLWYNIREKRQAFRDNSLPLTTLKLAIRYLYLFKRHKR